MTEDFLSQVIDASPDVLILFGDLTFNGAEKSHAALVVGKDYFVLTTNVDHQFQLAGFDKKRLFYPQGDWRLWPVSMFQALSSGNI